MSRDSYAQRFQRCATGACSKCIPVSPDLTFEGPLSIWMAALFFVQVFLFKKKCVNLETYIICAKREIKILKIIHL